MDIQEIGNKIKRMVKAHIFTQMDKNMKGYGLKIKNQGKETTIIKMAIYIKVNNFRIFRRLER
jgi:hypothetical protein